MSPANAFHPAGILYNPVVTQMQLPPFLDVPTLLESSRPRAPIPWRRFVLTGFVAITLVMLLTPRSAAERQIIGLFWMIVMAAVACAVGLMGAAARRTILAQEQVVEGLGEMLQLRKWQEAAVTAQQVLSQPTATLRVRAQALYFLSAILSRYQRFEDAIAVQEHLLGEHLLDETTAGALRVGRAMAMLREDRLFDADRAISELRRGDGAGESAGVALLELFRHVKTGHPDDAIELFEKKLPILRDQLSHRVADAYGLAARAYDLRERATEAADAWRDATLLAPVSELLRRYPELEKISSRYVSAAAPVEMQ